MSTVKAGPQQAAPEEGLPPSGIEQRAARRHLIQQRCIVSLPGGKGPEGWRSIAYNISTTGIGVLLGVPLQPGIELDIEPWNLPGTRTLRVRVVHCKPLEFAWMAGCELSAPLSETELKAWLAGKRPR